MLGVKFLNISDNAAKKAVLWAVTMINITQKPSITPTLNQSKLSLNQFRLLGHISSRAGAGEYKASRREMRRQIGMNLGTLSLAVKSLQKANHIHNKGDISSMVEAGCIVVPLEVDDAKLSIEEYRLFFYVVGQTSHETGRSTSQPEIMRVPGMKEAAIASATESLIAKELIVRNEQGHLVANLGEDRILPKSDNENRAVAFAVADDGNAEPENTKEDAAARPVTGGKAGKGTRKRTDKGETASDTILGGARADQMLRVMPLDAVLPRFSDTRVANAEIVLQLTETIAVCDLLHPLVVDRHIRLVAGLHRIEACRLLCAVDRKAAFAKLNGADKLRAEDWSARLDALPAQSELPEPLKSGQLLLRVLLKLDAAADPAAALAAEVAENTARKNYTKNEIAAWLERLRSEGYRETTGRPRTGEKALRPTLQLVLGVSEDTVRRILRAQKCMQLHTFSTPTSPSSHWNKKMHRMTKTYIERLSENAETTQSAAMLDVLETARLLKQKLEELLSPPTAE